MTCSCYLLLLLPFDRRNLQSQLLTAANNFKEILLTSLHLSKRS